MHEELRIRVRPLLTVVAILLALVTPAPAGAVTVPQAVSFQPTHTDAQSTVTVSFAAEGASELMSTAVLAGDVAFARGQDTCSGQTVTGTCTIEVVFAPLTVGDHSATLRLSGAQGDAVVTLSGTAYAVGSQLTVSPEMLTFQPLSPHQLSPPQRVTVTAGGDLPARITGVAFEGLAPDDFVITADGCTRSELAPGMSCVIEVRANPSGSAGSVARLRVLTDDPDVSVTIGLTVLASRPSAPLFVSPPPPTLTPPPWSLGIVSASYTARRTTVRLYSSFPTTVTITLTRNGRSVRRTSASINAGLVKVIVKGRVARGRYRVQVLAQRRSERRKDGIGLRVR